MDIKTKILDLFAYRKLPELLRLGMGQRMDMSKDSFFNLLVRLQQDIYELDRILEQEWHVLERDLKGAWGRIYRTLFDLGLATYELKDYCHNIYQYQKHELGQRKGKQITRLDMEYFYFYKSCDVKLIRRLIYDRYPHLEKHCPIAGWKWFDLITEVNDDVLDVFEDAGTNNGNRFLLHLQEDGLRSAVTRYTDFLYAVYRSFDNKLSNDPLPELVVTPTLGEYHATKELLVQRRSELSVSLAQIEGARP